MWNVKGKESAAFIDYCVFCYDSLFVNAQNIQQFFLATGYGLRITRAKHK